MLDLKKLESQIDQVLEKETTDSLLSWLYQKRISDMKKRLGAGVFASLNGCFINLENQKFKGQSLIATVDLGDEYTDTLLTNACYDIAA